MTEQSLQHNLFQSAAESPKLGPPGGKPGLGSRDGPLSAAVEFGFRRLAYVVVFVHAVELEQENQKHRLHVSLHSQEAPELLRA